jgi:uncharacterized membrane protein YozB (DUF420 family)
MTQALFDGPGFLGGHAPFASDVSLVLVCFSAVLLTIGWQLARRGHYEAHRWVQTSAVTLNTIVVVLVMIRSFLTHILPGIPTKLLQGDYGVTTLHALAGTIGVLLGVFVVLRANGFVPRALMFENYKAFMWTAYGLYMLGTVLGIAVYVLAFVLGI